MPTISRKDHSRIEQAANLAGNSNCTQRLGALLVSSGRVLATGHNTLRNTSMVTDPYSHAEHAEASVLRQLRERARGGTMYVARIKNSGGVGNALPCSRCMYKMLKAGVSRVVFTTEDGIWDFKLGQLSIEPYKEAATQVLQDENGFYRNVYLIPGELTEDPDYALAAC